MAKQVVASHPNMDKLTVIDHTLEFKEGYADASELSAAELKKLETFGFRVLIVPDEKKEDKKEDEADKKDEKKEEEPAKEDKKEESKKAEESKKEEKKSTKAKK